MHLLLDETVPEWTLIYLKYIYMLFYTRNIALYKMQNIFLCKIDGYLPITFSRTFPHRALFFQVIFYAF